MAACACLCAGLISSVKMKVKIEMKWFKNERERFGYDSVGKHIGNYFREIILVITLGNKHAIFDLEI